MIVKFWGTRGSIPVPGKDTVKYGGNTPCVELRTDKEILILDAGSGIRELGNQVITENIVNDIHIFFSHYHWDHIQGILFFKPLYDEKFRISFYGLSTADYSVNRLLSSQMENKNFPLSLEQVKAKLSYNSIYPNTNIIIGSISVFIFMANHSSPTLVYKFICEGHSIIYMTDNELNAEPSEKTVEYKSLVDFCSNCDFLIHDSMYDEISEKYKKGWGHSSNISLANFAIECNAKKVILFHFNPDHDDEKVDSLLEETIKYLRNNNSAIQCIAAKEGLEILL